METWKISNNSNEPVKVACKTNSMASKGIILNPGEFCISEAQLTASLDAQWRRGFVNVDKDFDNSKLQLEFVKSYKEEGLTAMIDEANKSEAEKDDFDKAVEDVEKYINKK